MRRAAPDAGVARPTGLGNHPAESTPMNDATGPDPVGAGFPRRRFLILLAAGMVAGLPGAGGCAGGPSGPSEDEEDRLRVFPQGIASADPAPDAVTLWVRAVPQGVDGPVPVRVEVAEDEAFEQLVARTQVEALADDDHTVRVRVTGLASYRTYYYRFEAEGVRSWTGRTRTAPGPDDDVPARFAVASCQEYVGRWYHAWRLLAEDPAEPDFVLFLGDYIYETIADPRFQPLDSPRSLSIPDGLSLDGSATNLAARTLADYRALYRQYRSDPDLRKMHQRFPFVAIWDDHEFTNDCWQDVANEFDGERGIERDTERRMAASRAWAEYVPSSLAYDPTRTFPDDLRTYRSFRWGRHLELFLTDSRSYRDDHVVDEGPPNPDVGKYTMNTAIGARILAIKEGFDPLEAQVRPSMLGAEQKQWLVGAIQGSTATWKGLVSALMMAQMALDLRPYDSLPGILRQDFYFKLDQWDGFRSERAEILEAVGDVPGLFVIAGDLHGNYVSRLHIDFDDPQSPAVAVEVTVTGISSISLQEQLDKFATEDPGLAATSLSEITPMFDPQLPVRNPHFRYANSSAYGYARFEVTADRVSWTFVEIEDVTAPTYDGPVVERGFTLPFGSTEPVPA